MAKQSRNRVGVAQVTDAQIAQMAELGVSADVTVDEVVASRAGSDDKVMAVVAENAPPRVKTYTPEGRAWIEGDALGLKTEGLYGQRGRLAIRPEDLQNRAQFLGRPLTPADLDEIHGLDVSAPETALCAVTGETLTQFVRTAMITKEGDLMRDKDGSIVYRGQFVVTGKPLAIHAASTGDALYKLRNARNKRKTLPNGRVVADLLPSQSYEQAVARLAGIQGHFSAKSAEKNAFQERIGFKVGDVADRGGRQSNGGFDRGSAAPRTPRGQSRKQPRRWVSDESAS